MKTLIGFGDTIIPQGYVPLARAAICLDCEALFVIGPSCPACASEHFIPLATWIFSALEAAFEGRITASEVKIRQMKPSGVSLEAMQDYLDAKLGDRPRRAFPDGSGYEILNPEGA